MNERPTGKDWMITVAILLICIGLIVAIENNLRHNPYEIETPSIENIDSLKTANDSIKNIIIGLDTIKLYEIQKVNALDNDSTIKLFQELVRE